MPYAQIEGGLLKGGILFDLGRALEAQLSAQVEFEVLLERAMDHDPRAFCLEPLAI